MDLLLWTDSDTNQAFDVEKKLLSKNLHVQIHVFDYHPLDASQSCGLNLWHYNTTITNNLKFLFGTSNWFLNGKCRPIPLKFVSKNPPLDYLMRACTILTFRWSSASSNSQRHWWKVEMLALLCWCLYDVAFPDVLYKGSNYKSCLKTTMQVEVYTCVNQIYLGIVFDLIRNHEELMPNRF